MPADSTHPVLRLTCLKLVGDLYMWIAHHRENWLMKVVDFLIVGIQENPQLDKTGTALNKNYAHFQLTAAESLKSVCTSCRRELAQHYIVLLQAADGVLDQLVWKAAHNLLTGVSYVVSECKFKMIKSIFSNEVFS